jgi:hypothetical protein
MNDDDDKVGYGKPPKHTRFKKGQSGNPRGRPPKSRNFDALIKQELDRKVAVKAGTEVKYVSKREAIAMTWIDGALRGNPRHLLALAKLARETTAPDPFGITPEENEDLEEALKAFQPSRKKDIGS